MIHQQKQKKKQKERKQSLQGAAGKKKDGAEDLEDDIDKKRLIEEID
jgi:hypothetical protein